MIKNIIFDFGGVILKHKSTLLEDKISQIFNISSEQALKVWQKERQSLLIGKISSKQFLDKLRIELNSDKPLSEIVSQWKEIYIKEAKDIDLELLKFIEDLKNNYQVFLLTDTIDTHDEYNSNRGIYDKFNKVFRSHIEGLSKLNDDAFINALNKIDANAEECVFIDDVEVNVERAENLGMKGIVYKNKENLKQELSKLGIIVDS